MSSVWIWWNGMKAEINQTNLLYALLGSICWFPHETMFIYLISANSTNLIQQIATNWIDLSAINEIKANWMNFSLIDAEINTLLHNFWPSLLIPALISFNSLRFSLMNSFCIQFPALNQNSLINQTTANEWIEMAGLW